MALILIPIPVVVTAVVEEGSQGTGIEKLRRRTGGARVIANSCVGSRVAERKGQSNWGQFNFRTAWKVGVQMLLKVKVGAREVQGG
jgi:hypothetical protein